MPNPSEDQSLGARTSLCKLTHFNQCFFKQEKLLENSFSSNFEYFPGYFLALFSSIFAAIFFPAFIFQHFFAAKITKNRFQQFSSKISLKIAGKHSFSGVFQQFSIDFQLKIVSIFSSNFRREVAEIF